MNSTIEKAPALPPRSFKGGFVFGLVMTWAWIFCAAYVTELTQVRRGFDSTTIWAVYGISLSPFSVGVALFNQRYRNGAAIKGLVVGLLVALLSLIALLAFLLRDGLNLGVGSG